jgi:hypothetical protein
MEENEIITIRLHRLHFNSNPCPRTLAMSWPHSQRVSPAGGQWLGSDFAAIMRVECAFK